MIARESRLYLHPAISRSLALPDHLICTPLRDSRCTFSLSRTSLSIASERVPLNSPGNNCRLPYKGTKFIQIVNESYKGLIEDILCRRKAISRKRHVSLLRKQLFFEP